MIHHDRRSLPDDWTEARASIRPQIRARSHLATNALWASAANIEVRQPPSWNLTKRHAMELVLPAVEAPPIVLTYEDFERWGVTKDDGYDSAIQNVAPRGQRVVTAMAHHVWRVTWNDGLDVERTVDAARWFADLPIAGNLVVLAISPNYLVVTGSETVDSLRAVLDPIAQQIYSAWAEGAPNAPAPTFFEPMVFGVEGWSVLPPGEVARIGDYHAVGAFVQSKMQQPLWLSICGGKYFVGNVDVQRGTNGALISYSVFGETVGRACLQASDYVVFVKGTPQAVTRKVWSSWRRIIDVLGDDVSQHGDFLPMRLDIDRFPTDAELDALER